MDTPSEYEKRLADLLQQVAKTQIVDNEKKIRELEEKNKALAAGDNANTMTNEPQGPAVGVSNCCPVSKHANASHGNLTLGAQVMPAVSTPIKPFNDLEKLATAAKKYVNSIEVDFIQGVAVAISCGECSVNATRDATRARYMDLNGMRGHYKAKHDGKGKKEPAILVFFFYLFC